MRCSIRMNHVWYEIVRSTYAQSEHTQGSSVICSVFPPKRWVDSSSFFPFQCNEQQYQYTVTSAGYSGHLRLYVSPKSIKVRTARGGD